MPKVFSSLLVSVLLGAFCVAQPATAPPDSTLYTTYSLYSSNQMLDLSVCGSTQQSSGCYGGASLGPFNGVGAMLEGNPSVNGNVVTRAIYVVDSGAAAVKLYIYKKTDTVTAQFDTVAVTLAKTISLPLVGGSGVVCSMAGNNGFLFIGTNQSPQAVEINKKTLSVQQVGGFSPPVNVTAITADQYGYVTVTQGSFGSGENGFYVFGPNGSGQEDGGGASFMLNTVQAVQTSNLPNAR